MKKKASEAEFKRIMSNYDTCARKFRDVWFCQFCHRPQYKSDALPDYMIVRSGQSYLVVVRQSNEHWSFAVRDGAGIRDIQRQTRDAWEEEHNPCWWFLVLGAGRVPDGHSGWVLSWSEWKKIERRFIESNQKSIRRETKGKKGALGLLKNCNVVWSKTNSGGTIPQKQNYWKTTGGFKR